MTSVRVQTVRRNKVDGRGGGRVDLLPRVSFSKQEKRERRKENDEKRRKEGNVDTKFKLVCCVQ